MKNFDHDFFSDMIEHDIHKQMQEAIREVKINESIKRFVELLDYYKARYFINTNHEDGRVSVQFNKYKTKYHNRDEFLKLSKVLEHYGIYGYSD